MQLNTSSVWWSTDAFKLIVDKRPVENIKEFIEIAEEHNSKIQKRSVKINTMDLDLYIN